MGLSDFVLLPRVGPVGGPGVTNVGGSDWVAAMSPDLVFHCGSAFCRIVIQDQLLEAFVRIASGAAADKKRLATGMDSTGCTSVRCCSKASMGLKKSPLSR